MGLQESFDIAYPKATGETNTKFLVSLVKELRKAIFRDSGIKIDVQYLYDELKNRVKEKKSMRIIKDRKRCREAVMDILMLPELGE